MTRNDIINLLEISCLDDILIDNIIQLNDLYPDYHGKYNVEECCNVYADATLLYRMYLPDYIAAKFLDTRICDLIEMNIECIPTPSEYQSIFYDRYEANTFQYSKYLFRTSDVLIIFQTYSKGMFLEMIPEIVEMNPEKFFSLEDTGRILGMSRIKTEMYHFYFMELNIRFAYFDGERKYFLDDIRRVLDYTQDFFDENYSDYELTQKYSYACYEFMQNGRIKEKSNIDNIYFDVILSDARFPNGFQQSCVFYPKKAINEAYYSWFTNYNRMICRVEAPAYHSEDLYKEVLYDISNFAIRDPQYGILSHVYDISDIYKMNDILWRLENNEKPEYYAYRNSLVSKKIIYFIFGIEEENHVDFDLSIRKIAYNDNYYGISEVFNLYRKYLFETSYNKFSKIKKKQHFYDVFEKSKFFTHLIKKEDMYEKNSLYVWCNEIYYYSPVELRENSSISFIELRKSALEWYYGSEIMEIKLAKYFDEVYISNQTLSKQVFNIYENQIKNSLRFLPPKHSKKYSYNFNSLSVIKVINELPSESNLFSLAETVKFLGIANYPFTLLWNIFLNCGLTILFYNCRFYFYVNELVELQIKINSFINGHLSFNQIYDITHGKIGYVGTPYEVTVINWAYAYLISLDNPCFVYYEGLSELYLENSLNYPYECKLFLTDAEAEGNLHMLPRMIPWTLTNALLHIEDDTLNVNNYFNKNKVFMMVEQLNEFKENYVPKDKIFEFLGLDLKYFTKNDLKMLDTIQLINIPWSVKHSKDWYNAESKSNYAYRKADLYILRDYFHRDKKDNFIDYNNVYCIRNEYGSNWYETYKLRLSEFISHAGLDLNKEFYNIWDEFIRNRLMSENGSQRTIEGNILKYIKICYTIYFIIEEKKVQLVRQLTTNDINEFLDGRIPVTYCSILLGFFRYAANLYNSRLEKVSYRVKGLRIPKRTSQSSSDIIPQIYNFEDYSRIFDFCNNYQKHIKKAVNEIQQYGTCIYASTWFYVMSHLNNTWRSSDFTYFPNINIEKVIVRNIKQEGYSWFLNNNLPKSEALIIALGLQNHPKVISKTKKYTVFMCSDELLITYTTVYMLLSYFTEFLSYDREFVCHFNNQYNCLNEIFLNDFFNGLKISNFKFKSRKMNKTLLTMIDFLEEFYIGNDYDQMRREAMLLRSHVNPESTIQYIKKYKEVFERLTNMLCARGEFGYVYEYLVNVSSKKEVPANIEEKTDKIREIRNYIPDVVDVESIFSFMNFTKKEKNGFMQYINSLSLNELQQKMTELYLRKNPSKMSSKLPCFHNKCPKFNSKKESECASCILHIPTVYSLVTICRSLNDDIQEYSVLVKEYMHGNIKINKLMRNIMKKSVDVITAKNIFGDEVLEEIFNISGLYYETFMEFIMDFNKNTQSFIEQRGGESIV